MTQHSWARIALALGMAGLLAATAVARDGDRERGNERGVVLALGDSIAFGYITRAYPQYLRDGNFVGYPEFLGVTLDLDVVNLGCPGATSGHLLSTSLPDYNANCVSYRSNFPLHVRYSGSQLDYAKSYLPRHRETRLVTIGVGANDVFALQARCAANPAPYGDFQTCVGAELQSAVLPALWQNLAALISAVKGTGYRGPIVIANYYSPDYTDPSLTFLTGALNQTLAGVAQAYGAKVADVFSAFQEAAATPAAGGRTCATGLLNVDPLNPTACDVHPSLTGQRLVAKSIVATLRRRD